MQTPNLMKPTLLQIRQVLALSLKDIHPSPLHLKSGSKFQIVATVVNDSPSKITFTAGVCDSPLSAQFLNNVVIRYMQGCTANFTSFRIKIWRRSYCSGTIFWYNLSSISSWTNNSECHFVITRLRMDRPQTLHNLLYSQ